MQKTPGTLLASIQVRAYIDIRASKEGKTMLDAYIIEELKKRRREQARRRDERPVVELPLEEEPNEKEDSRPSDDEQRGVIIIDFGS